MRLAIELVQRHNLRDCDAVQLASALQVWAECAALGTPAPIFVSTDNNLNAAAIAEGRPAMPGWTMPVDDLVE